LTRWFNVTNATVALEAIAPTLHDEIVRGFVRDSAENHFVITAQGKLKVEDPENWTESVVQLPTALLDKIPTVDGVLAAPAVVSSEGNKLSYFVQSGERRISTTAAMTNEFLGLISQPRAVLLPQSAINTVPNVGVAMAPGTIVKASNSPTLFLVDDLNRKVRLASSVQAKSVSNSRTYTFTSAQLAKLETRTGFTSFKVQCNSETYLLDGGTLYPVAPEVASHFPGNAYPLATSTCASFNLSERAIGQFVRDSRGSLFFVENGVRKRISNWTHFGNLRGDGPGYLQASAWVAGLIPVSGRAPAIVQLASLENTPTGNFGELSFVGSVPDPGQNSSGVTAPSPTPTPTPTPSPTPTPAPSPSSSPAATDSVQEYRVASGDSLNSIAARFDTTASRIQQFNNISNPNLIRVGQLIRIPAADSPATAPAPTPSPAPAPTPAPTPAPEAATEVEYRIQSGDTLLRIGAKFGVSASLIQSHNGITNPRLIRIGQLIKIPTGASSVAVTEPAAPVAEPEPKTYRVAAGDSLWGIARKFGVSSSELATINGITNANLIRIGQVLKIPN
jgi:LysM repeat protein